MIGEHSEHAKTAPTLALKSVDFTYAAGTPYEKVALTDVNAEFRRGECVLLAGATGSGKSTLLQILAGLLQADSGELLFQGKACEDPVVKRVWRRNVGLAFQFPESQLFAETVSADVGYVLTNRGIGEPDLTRQVEEALVKVGLEPGAFGSRNPLMMSGGEQRRAALAGVLAGNPEILLLDEPCVGLDGEGRKIVLDILTKLRDSRERTMILVTHDIERYIDLADRFLLIRNGSLVLDSDLDGLSENVSLLSEVGVKIPFFLALDHILKNNSKLHPGSKRSYTEMSEYYSDLFQRQFASMENGLVSTNSYNSEHPSVLQHQPEEENR